MSYPKLRCDLRLTEGCERQQSLLSCLFLVVNPGSRLIFHVFGCKQDFMTRYIFSNTIERQAL